MPINAGTAIAYLELDTSKFTSGFQSAYNDLKVFADRSSTAEQKLKGLSSAFGTVGSVLSKSVTLPIVGVGVAALKTSTDFEKGMSQVKAIANATGEEFDQLHDKALELGADTSFSASEVANAMTEMAKAGWTTQDILDGMQGVLDATAASGENLATVSTIVADAVTTFGLSASESTRVADLLSQAANAGTISVSDLGESLKYIGPIANTMGFSIEDVTTAITAMSEAGIRGSQAGTSLRMMFTRLFKPTDQVRDAMDELNIVIADENGNFKDMDTILAEMRETFQTLTPEQQAYYAATLAGAEASSGLISILNMTQEEYDAIAATMDNASGTAAQTAAVMKDNLAGSLEQLGGALESAGIVIGEVLTPYIRDLADWIQELVNKFNGLSEEEQEQVVKIGAVVASIGPALLIFSKLMSVASTAAGAIRTVTAAFSTMGEAITLVNAGFPHLAAQMGGVSGLVGQLSLGFSGALVPILAVVAAIGTLVAAFVTLWKTNEEFRNNITNTWNEIKQAFTDFFDGVTERINQLGFDFENITQVLSAAWLTFCNVIAPIFEGAFQTVLVVVQGILNNILSVMDIFIGIFTGNWEQAINGVKGFLTNFVQTASSLISNIFGVVGSVGSKILSALGFEEAAQQFQEFFDTANEVLGEVTEVVSEFVVDMVDFFTKELPEAFDTFVNETLPNAIDSVKETINGIIETITSIPGKVSNAFSSLVATIVNFANNVKNTIVEAFNTLINETIPNFINSVVQWFTELPNRIGYALGTIAGTIVKVFAGIGIWATTELPLLIENIVSWFAQLPDKIYNAIVQTITNVTNWGNQVYQQATTSATNTVNDVTTWFSELPDKIYNAIVDTINRIVEWGNQVYQQAVDAVTKTVNDIVTWFSELPGKIKAVFDSVIEKVIEWKDSFLNFITVEIPALVETFVSWFTSLPDRFIEIGTNIINGLWQGIQNAWSGLMSGVTDFCNGFLDGFRNALDMHSPSKKMEEIGTLSIDGLMKPFSSLEKLQQIKTFAQTLLETLRTALNPEIFAEIMAQFLEGANEVLQTWGQGLTESGSQMGQAFVSGFLNPFATMAEQLSILLSTILEYINSWVIMMNETSNTMSLNFVNTIMSQFSRIPGIVSMYLNQTYALTFNWSINMRVLATTTATMFIQNLFVILNTLPTRMSQLLTRVVNTILSYRELMFQAGTAIMQRMLDGMQEVGTQMLSYCRSLTNQIMNIFRLMISNVLHQMDAFVSQMISYMANMTDNVISYCDRMISAFNRLIAKAKEARAAAASVNGSHANGLDYVPFDGYIAELHKGERVLTRQENEAYSQGRIGTSGGDTFNFYNTQPNPYEYARQMKRAKRELLHT